MWRHERRHTGHPDRPGPRLRGRLRPAPARRHPGRPRRRRRARRGLHAARAAPDLCAPGAARGGRRVARPAPRRRGTRDLGSRPLDRPDTTRSGRLIADADALDGRVNDTYADDAGIDGGAASAEEAAVHIVEEP
ncbi:DUF5709 domain-containing protein [Oerskovia sp. M15]